jgi:hypothetical protein
VTSALDGGEWSASRTGRFTPRERSTGTHWIGGWMGPRAVLDAVVKDHDVIWMNIHHHCPFLKELNKDHANTPNFSDIYFNSTVLSTPTSFFPSKILYEILMSPFMLLSPPIYRPSFHHRNNIWRKIQKKLRLSFSLCSFLYHVTCSLQQIL